MNEYLEPIGPTLWLGSLCLLFIGMIAVKTFRRGEMSSARLLRLLAVVLLTPLVYLGHPLIFAPLWIYIGNSLQGSAVILGVWALVASALEFSLVLRRRRSERAE